MVPADLWDFLKEKYINKHGILKFRIVISTHPPIKATQPSKVPTQTSKLFLPRLTITWSLNSEAHMHHVHHYHHHHSHDHHHQHWHPGVADVYDPFMLGNVKSYSIQVIKVTVIIRAITIQVIKVVTVIIRAITMLLFHWKVKLSVFFVENKDLLRHRCGWTMDGFV